MEILFFDTWASLGRSFIITILAYVIMIVLLALRNLAYRPWRSLFLLAGYGVGVAVMTPRPQYRGSSTGTSMRPCCTEPISRRSS